MRTLGLLLVLSGCVPARRKVEGNIVRDVHFVGNDDRLFSGQTDYELRQALESKGSGLGLTLWPFVYTVEPRSYRPDFVARDAYRLEVWYAHHGWFDARFEGWEVRFVRPQTERRAGVVDLIGRVAPGVPSTVRSIALEGVPTILDGVVGAALRRSEVQEGDPFDLASLEATRLSIETHLQDHARPYAKVAMDVTAHPEEHVVDVTYRVVPGIVGSIGPVNIRGEKVVDERFIEEAARLETGSAYKLEALRDAQRRMFEMGTFSVVTVEPVLNDPTRTEVPIRVHVTETRFRRFRVGVGFDYDSYLPVVRTSTRLRDVNLFHELLRAEIGAKVGLAVDVAGGDYTRLPTWGVDLAFRDPRLFDQRVSFELTGAVTQDIYNGLWAYQRPEADVHLVVRASDAVQFRVGPHVERYKFLGEFGPRVQEAQQRLFGIESSEAFLYELTSLDQFAQWDWRDDPIRTTRGSWYTLSFREAIPLTRYGNSFFRGSGEARRYIPLRLTDRTSAFPLTLAGRTAGTVVVPFRANAQIPLPERAYLGGPTTIRGFRPNQVGPYTTLCTYESVTRRDGFLGLFGDPVAQERVTQYHLPDGGSLSGEVSAELRYDWVYGILLSGFVDAGALTQQLSTLGTDDLRFSGGLGMRYDTVVGPLRVDVSLRPLYPEDSGPSRYAQCDVADEVPRVVDLLGNFGDPRLRADQFPLAVVFYLTFGEAI